MNLKKYKGAKNDELRSQFRINEQIRNSQIRLVGDNFEEISSVAGKNIEPGVYNTDLVLAWADELGLDLVEITAKADPPVCKIIDFNKFLYLKRKKEKEIKSKTAKTIIKEIRFGPHTDDHDFEFKMKHAIKFLQEGAKVKAFVQFRGRAIVFKDQGELILLRFAKELEPYGSAEELPKLEGKRMHVVFSPKKTSSKSSK